MNGMAYKNMLTSNNDGYYTKTNHNQMPNPALQQQNVHGRNDLHFPEGSPPYGFYDQSNFAGINSLMCGPLDAPNIRMIQRGQPSKESYRNEYPGSYGMPGPGMYQPTPPNRMYQPNMNMDMNMNKAYEQPMYTHETACMQDMAGQKNRGVGNGSVSGKDKKDLNRKNMSKLKKGMIDINIETSSSNRQGVTIDLNIGVGN